jgi:hypothetical protein
MGIYMKNNKQIWLSVFTVALLVLVGFGCEVGVNPLLFDGSPLAASFTVNTTGTSYNGSTTLNLNDVVKDFSKSIDSTDVFNVTIRIENASSPENTTISGIGQVDGNTLLQITNVPLSTFATEKSVFDKSITGFNVDASGFLALRTLVKNALQQPDMPHTATLSLSGTASQSPLQFTIYVKIYTQLYTNP